jgi:hypothetical protein
MATYYRVLVKYEETHEVIVHALTEDEAKEKAMNTWQNNEDYPLDETAYVYDIQVMEIKNNG